MKQKRILVTGAGSGFGREVALRLAARGHRTIAGVRGAGQAADLREEAGRRGVPLRVETLDITVAADRERAWEWDIDVLLNNAGSAEAGASAEIPLELVRALFETNVFAVVGVTRALFPLLRRKSGLVVNVGSVSGVLVTPFAGAYCASKAAVHALSDALRLELAPFGVEVLEVQPGAIASNFGASASREMDSVVDERSPWWPLRRQIQARAAASQDNPTSAEDFARQLLAAVQRRPRPPLVRIGNGSRALPALARWLPRGLLERLLKKRFGLDTRL